MLFSTLLAIANFITQPAYGAKTPSAELCAAVFDFEEPRLARALVRDLYEISGKEGVPDRNAHLKLNDKAQLRIYTRDPIVEIGQTQSTRVVYLEVLRPIEDVSSLQDVMLFERAYGPLFQTYAEPGGRYQAFRWEPVAEIPVDIHTGYMRADNKTVEKLLEALVLARGKEETNAMLFIDLDHLNLMNYTAGGHAFGDRYIRESLRVVAEHLRIREESGLRPDRRDIPFRLQNGDEYFFLLQGTSPAGLEVIKRRINEAFRNDPAIMQLTIEAHNSYMNFLANLIKLKSFQQLLEHPNVHKFITESQLWKQMSPAHQVSMTKDSSAFQAFLQAYVNSREAQLRGDRLLALQLGVSIGGVMIRPDHVYTTLYNEADVAMRQDKTNRKLLLSRELPADLVDYNKPDIHFPPLSID
jgi:GGDEF domain-containing protein